MEVIGNENAHRLERGRRVAIVIYTLQAASFVLPIAFVGAVVLGYIMRSDVEGSWLASHYRWQIRTFWFALLWAWLALMTFAIGLGALLAAANGVWIVYRIAKGWLRLSERRPV